MPSLRKLVENVEYNELPSPMKPDFASVYKSGKDSAVDKPPAANSGAIESAKTTQGDTKYHMLDQANQKQFCKKSNGDTSNRLVGDGVIELLSDEEDTNPTQLEKSKQNGTASDTTSSLAAKIGEADNSTVKARGAENTSYSSTNGKIALSSTKNSKEVAANKKKSVVTNGSIIGTAANKPSQPVQMASSNNNHSISATQVQCPYSTNPTLQKNADAILQNIRMSLQQTLPQPSLQPFAYGPAAVTAGLGLERWSENRIDAASTIEDLEAIRNRLLTLTKRADLRLREMNFLKAIGMIKSKDDGEHEMDVIQKLVRRAESKLTVNSKNEENDRKRKRLEATFNNRDDKYTNCCPFCLSNNTPRDADDMNMCSICEEQSNMCSQCRGYCIKCHRLACEDCLMRCDTCFSDTYCSDCMPKNGQCSKCSSHRLKPSAANHLRTLSNPKSHPPEKKNPSRPVSRTEFPWVLKPQPTANATQQYTLHRFIVNKAGTIGLTVTQKAENVYVRSTTKDSHAEKLGIKINDEICLPFTNGWSAKNCKFDCHLLLTVSSSQ